MKKLFISLLLLLPMTTFAVEQPVQEKVLNYFKSDQEPAVKDALWTDSSTFKVGMLDDGTDRTGFASYICEVLRDNFNINGGVSVVVIDIEKLVETHKWIELGKTNCPVKEIAKKTDLGVTYNVLRDRVNADFKVADLPYYKMPKKLKINKDNIGTIKFNKSFATSITFAKDNKIQSIIAALDVSNDNVKTLKRYFAAALILSGVAGDEANKTIGNQLVTLAGPLFEKFAQDPTQSYSDNIFANGIEYGVLIAPKMPIMLFANPVK